MIHQPVSRGEYTHRFFFALKPDPVTARRTDVFAEGIAGGARRIRPEHLHMTLAITHDYPDYPYALVERLLEAGDSIRADPLTVTFDRLVEGYRSVSLRPSHRDPVLIALQKDIAAAAIAHGALLREDYSFDPHQTLCYRDGPVHQRRCPPIAWAVRELALVHSIYGRTQHATLRSWALTGAPQGTFGF